MKLAFLCSPDMMPDTAARNPYDAEGNEQLEKIIPALDKRGISLERVDWRRSRHRAGEFDAFLPLFAWDYWDAREAFVETLHDLARQARVLNPPSMIDWNTDKSYLLELECKGVPTIPMQMVERVTKSDIEHAFETFGTDKLVVKPRVGGGGFGQSVFNRGQDLNERSLPTSPAIIQPFQDFIEIEGEVTTVWFGGRYSHALRKVPKAGDYRVQSHYGGHEEPCVASPEHIAVAKAALAVLPEVPLYARIDLLKGNDGRINVMEVELIEPYFYLAMAPETEGDLCGASLFARAVEQTLDQKQRSK